MNQTEANEMRDLLLATGKFDRVDIEQQGGEFALATSPWVVWAWRINPTTGTMTPTQIDDYAPSGVPGIVDKAVAADDARKTEVYRRREAEKDLDQS